MTASRIKRRNVPVHNTKKENIMKYRKVIGASLCAGIVGLCVWAGEASAEGICQQKMAHIQRQIDYAKKHNNPMQVAGLERALDNVRTWCTDDGELAEAEIAVMEKQEKVQERQAELDKDVAQGKQASKIAKRKQKLQEAQTELQEAEKVRDTMKASKK